MQFPGGVKPPKITCECTCTHHAASFHAHVRRGHVETGRPVPDALGQADVEAISGGPAGQLALLIRSGCNTRRINATGRSSARGCERSVATVPCVCLSGVKDTQLVTERLSTWRGSLRNPPPQQTDCLYPLYECTHCCTYPGDTSSGERCKHQPDMGLIYSPTGPHSSEACIWTERKGRNPSKSRQLRGKPVNLGPFVYRE